MHGHMFVHMWWGANTMKLKKILQKLEVKNTGDKSRGVDLRPGRLLFLELRESEHFKTWVLKSILTESEVKLLILGKS